MAEKETLQGQHYNMAAIIGRGWSYEDKPDEKRSRLQSVCQFDTSNMFIYTEKEKKKNGNIDFFTYMANKENRDQRIIDCISGDSSTNTNVLAKSIFKSHLITTITEEKLNVNIIEKQFLSLLENTNNLQDLCLSSLSEPNRNIINNYIALQYVRNPIFYRFLFNKFFNQQLEKIFQNVENDDLFDEDFPYFFKYLTLLNSTNLNQFIDFANKEIIYLYAYFRKKINNNIIRISNYNPDYNNFLGDLSCFNLNFTRLSIESHIINQIVDYENNKKFFNNCIYTVINHGSCIFSIDSKTFNSNSDLTHKMKTLITPILQCGFQNQIVFLYSKYFLFHPTRKNKTINYLKDVFDKNSLQKIHEIRTDNIEYLDTFEMLLQYFIKKELF